MKRGDLILQQIVEYGGHTRPEVAFLSSVVAEGDTILDVGAHVGTFAIPLARKAGPGGMVCAFEPSPDSYPLLVLNIEMNGLTGLVWPIEKAVSDRVQSFAIEIPNLRNTGGSFLIDGDEGIESIVLDEWVDSNLAGRRIDLIKIDVEGMEPLVLAGARGLMERDSPCLYLEVSSENYARYGVTISEVAELVKGSRIFVNQGERNAASDEFKPAEIADLQDMEASHFDVLVVPPARFDRVTLCSP